MSQELLSVEGKAAPLPTGSGTLQEDARACSPSPGAHFWRQSSSVRKLLRFPLQPPKVNRWHTWLVTLYHHLGKEARHRPTTLGKRQVSGSKERCPPGWLARSRHQAGRRLSRERLDDPACKALCQTQHPPGHPSHLEHHSPSTTTPNPEPTVRATLPLLTCPPLPSSCLKATHCHPPARSPHERASIPLASTAYCSWLPPPPYRSCCFQVLERCPSKCLMFLDARTVSLATSRLQWVATRNDRPSTAALRWPERLF